MTGAFKVTLTVTTPDNKEYSIGALVRVESSKIDVAEFDQQMNLLKKVCERCIEDVIIAGCGK